MTTAVQGIQNKLELRCAFEFAQMSQARICRCSAKQAILKASSVATGEDFNTWLDASGPSDLALFEHRLL